MTKRPYSKRLRLAMRFSDGHWELEIGGQVPVKHGTVADFLVDVSAITDKDFLRRLQEESAILILKPGSKLRAYINYKDGGTLSADQRSLLIPLASVRSEMVIDDRAPWSSGEVGFVEVTIGKPTDKQVQSFEFRDGGLWLILEGQRPAELRSSMIELPEYISKEPAISLNHAFTRLSEVYEPWRKSHTGSVYQRFFYQEKSGKWHPLERLRDIKIGEKENEIANQLWKDFVAKMASRKA